MHEKELNIFKFLQNISESERIEIIDKFALEFTPVWFNYLKWILIYGTIVYFLKESTNTYIKIALYGIQGISFVLIYQWQLAICFRFKFKLPFVRNPNIAHKLSMFLSGLLAMSIYWGTLAVIEVAKTKH